MITLSEYLQVVKCAYTLEDDIETVDRLKKQPFNAKIQKMYWMMNMRMKKMWGLCILWRMVKQRLYQTVTISKYFSMNQEEK